MSRSQHYRLVEVKDHGKWRLLDYKVETGRFDDNYFLKDNYAIPSDGELPADRTFDTLCIIPGENPTFTDEYLDSRNDDKFTYGRGVPDDASEMAKKVLDNCEGYERSWYTLSDLNNLLHTEQAEYNLYKEKKSKDGLLRALRFIHGETPEPKSEDEEVNEVYSDEYYQEMDEDWEWKIWSIEREISAVRTIVTMLADTYYSEDDVRVLTFNQ